MLGIENILFYANTNVVFDLQIIQIKMSELKIRNRNRYIFYVKYLSPQLFDKVRIG